MRSDEKSPSAKTFPAHLCDSGVSTHLLQKTYPEGASGPVQMMLDHQSTGSILHFLEKKGEAGNSAWVCDIQFDGETAESSLYEAVIIATTKGKPSLLPDTRRLAGHPVNSLSLGIIHGINGPDRSALEFPCMVTKDRKVTIFVGLFHPVDLDATEAYRKRVVDISEEYIRDFARYVVNKMQLCSNLPEFPAGKFTNKPISEESPQPSARQD